LAGQYNFVHNGVRLFSSQDVQAAEEAAHYAMAQRPGAKRVLLISGGVSGTAKEILKHGVEAVDYVELDPLIIEAAKRYVPESLDDPRIRVIETDGRLYVKQTQQKYDVVIADVPEPSTFQLNRFYTREFFAEVKDVLEPGGVFAFSLGHYENFLSDELRDLIATADRTLRQEFSHVLILPDGKITFLASDAELTEKIADRIEQAGIDNRWVNRDYLQGTLTPARLEVVASARSDEAAINRDFDPILYYQRLRLWMSQFSFKFGLLEGGLLVLLVLFLVRLRPVPLAMFTTGFAASGLEVVLLVGFQILYGSVYHQVGLIVTMFMIGLGIGSLTMNRMKRRGRRDLAVLELALAVYAGCLPLVLIGLGQLRGAVAPIAAQVVVPLLTLLLAVLVGLEFPLAGRADFRTVTSTAADLYTADYVGAAMGALLVSTLLIPLWGVTAVCLLAAGANLASGAVLLVTSKSSSN
ncbi:MAG TPA: fused MFS/spermidine synthase, partial [Thermoguttaceae bacterium]|nr:fused MFS/spermidine synthase [Thermoguttaceae bacterium]